MKCSEICEIIEREYSPEYACDWDNVGLLAGRRDKEVKSVLLSLDATDEVVELAAEQGADMLITHHPMLFSAIKRVTTDDLNGRRLLRLIQSDISYYAMHTNYDTCGMADLAARMMNLRECAVLDEIKDGEGIGRVGKLERRMTLKECAEQVKKAYNIPSVKVFGDLDGEVELAAICPGAGKGSFNQALRFGCDVYITGDIDHHTGIDAVDLGVNIIDAGHYGIEHIFMEDLRAYLEKNTAGLIIRTVPVKHPFSVL